MHIQLQMLWNECVCVCLFVCLFVCVCMCPLVLNGWGVEIVEVSGNLLETQ